MERECETAHLDLYTFATSCLSACLWRQIPVMYRVTFFVTSCLARACSTVSVATEKQIAPYSSRSDSGRREVPGKEGKTTEYSTYWWGLRRMTKTRPRRRALELELVASIASSGVQAREKTKTIVCAGKNMRM